MDPAIDISLVGIVLPLALGVACTLALLLGLFVLAQYRPDWIPGWFVRQFRGLLQNDAASERMPRVFLDTMNHELRTPLAGMLASAQILKEEIGPEHRELTDMLIASTHRLDKTLERLLELAALEKNAVSWRPQKVYIAGELKPIFDLHRKKAASKGLVLHASEMDPHLMAHVDPLVFPKVIDNLLDNAIKFTEQGFVSVTVRQDDRCLRVVVKDTGIGISKMMQQTIYAPFVQGSHGVRRTHEGQGLGLTLTKKMLELAGGRLDVTSTSGAGSTFVASFPTPHDA